MRIDGIQLTEGSNFRNATIDSGTSFPSLPGPGELFFRTDSNAMYARNNANWVELAAQSTITNHIADDARHLTAVQNTLLDGINVSFTDINSIPSIAANLAAHAADNARHLVQSQRDLLTSLPSTVAAFSLHIADDTRHLSASQNALLDGLSPTMTAQKINFLDTAVAPIQEQLLNRIVRTGDTMTGQLVLGAGKPLLPSQAANKQYVDDFQPFLNLPPRAGYPSRQDSVAEVPVYADFKFSRKTSFSAAPLVVDDEDREVVYWPCVIDYNTTRCFQSVRYGTGQEPVYSNIPVKPACFAPNEEMILAYGAGTYYIDMPWVNTVTKATGRRLIKTNGKSDPSKWTEYFNITENTGGIGQSFNAGYAYEKTTDRIIRISFLNSDPTKVVVQVFDTSLNKLGPAHQIFSFWDDVDYTDGANGRVVVGGGIGYLPQVLPIAYDPINEVLYSTFALALNITDAGGVNPRGENCVATMAWKFPKSVLTTGTGTITNLNPYHTGNNYRYWHHAEASSVGLCSSYALPINLAFDSFYNNLNVNASPGWESGINNIFYQLPCTNKVYNTISPSLPAPNAPTYFEGISLPDASPWAKTVYDDMTFIGDSMQFLGGDKNGNYFMQTKFFPDQLGTVMAQGEAIKFVPNTWVKIKDAYPDNVFKLLDDTAWFSTVVFPDKTVKTYTLGLDRTTIYEIVVGADGKWTPTDTGVKLPIVPAGNYWYNKWAWNGNAAAPVFYYVIVWGANPLGATTEKDFVKIATSRNGVFTVNTKSPAEYAQQTSNSSYGGAGSRIHRIHSMCYTESGNVMTGISTLYAFGGAYGSIISRMTPDGTVTDVSSVSPYSGGTARIGYHASMGYYITGGGDPNIATPMVTAKHAGVPSDPVRNEIDFFNGVGWYTKYNTISATVGLVAYITAFPLFLGGYFSMIQNTSVNLSPNANNYIYLRRDPNDRTKFLTLVTIDQLLPNNFSRVLISKVVTNATGIVSSTNYPV